MSKRVKLAINKHGFVVAIPVKKRYKVRWYKDERPNIQSNND